MNVDTLLAVMVGLSFIGLFIVFLQQRSLEDKLESTAQALLDLDRRQETHEGEFKSLIEWLSDSFEITWDEREKLMKIREGMRNAKYIEGKDRKAPVETEG